jgi:Family of unknown function (DUF5694)
MDVVRRFRDSAAARECGLDTDSMSCRWHHGSRWCPLPASTFTVHRMPLIRRTAVHLLLGLGLAGGRPGRAAAETAPARVLLLGLFHFDNPGLDAVRYTPLDVLQPAAQAYLEGLAVRLARFAPTKLLLEYPERADAGINARYAAYRAGTGGLRRNEIDQIGFRVARLAGLARVHGFDAEAPPGGDALWSQLPKEPAAERRLLRLVESESRRLEQAHRTMSLAALLAMTNSRAEDLRNKGFYMLLNGVGAEDGRFLGADASAHWWQRNLRMYARVQAQAAAGERVLVIAGSGHTAILRDLLEADSERIAEEVQPYLLAP